MYIFSFGTLNEAAPSTASREEAWDDGTSYFRLYVRYGRLYLDQTITALGFNGNRGTDWDFVWYKSIS